MTQPPEGGLPALVVHAARDIDQVANAFDAELLLSTLIGSIYSAVESDRDDAIEAFIEALDGYLAGAAEEQAPLVRGVLARMTGREASAPPARAPAWLPQVGDVRLTGSYVYGDRYGDQTSYVATFAYADADLGGPEHAIVVLADHNLGVAKDLFVGVPAARMLEQLRADVDGDPDEMTWFSEIEPATLRSAAMAYMTCTDNAAELPESDSLASNRAMIVTRLRLLPEAPEPAVAAVASPADIDTRREALIEEFLASPEADLAGLTEHTGAARESLTYCLGLIVDFATSRGDKLRWSPAGVETFLGTWVHERAILDDADTALLPDALRAWIAWAGHRLSLPAPALQETLGTVRACRDEFVRLHATGERQSPAAAAMAAMITDGIDLTDMSAVDDWLRAHNDADR